MAPRRHGSGGDASLKAARRQPGGAPETTVLWRRLDPAGHDAATIEASEAGIELRGMAVFHDAGGPAALHYRIRCDTSSLTTTARILGWCGLRQVELQIERDAAGRWTLNGVACTEVAGCVDLDLGFTPATNLLPLRRLSLATGQSAEVRSAWLESPGGSLAPLVQRYHRATPSEYVYEADLPGGAQFGGKLRVTPGGWVLDYADLWRAEATA